MGKEKLPPRFLGLTNQDPEIPLNNIVTEPREWEPGPSLSNSFGFGGTNASLVFQKFSD